MQIQLKLTEEQERVLLKIAASQGISVAELVRKIVDDYARNNRWRLAQEELSPDERRRRGLAFVGKYSSGEPDISEEHDRYLAEIYEENINDNR